MAENKQSAKRSVYRLEGKDVKGKNKLVWEIVKLYIERNPDVTLSQLFKTMNVVTLIRGGNVVDTYKDALKIHDDQQNAGGNYFIAPGDHLNVGDEKIVVWKYWPDRFFSPFIDIVKKNLGFNIEVVEEAADTDNATNSTENVATKETESEIPLKLSVGSGMYQVYIIPIVDDGIQMADDMIDNGDVDYDMINDIENIACECDLDRPSLVFYQSESEPKWSVSIGHKEEIDDADDNSLVVVNQSQVEEDDELSDDFELVGNLSYAASEWENDVKEVYNDMLAIHNEREDEHVDFIKDALCRRMRQIATKLVDNEFIESVDDAKFVLEYGKFYSYCDVVEYTIPVSGKFKPELLRPIDCTDWVDCDDISNVLLDGEWADRLASCVVYDGKLYSGTANCESFDYTADIVNCDLESLI